MARGYPCAGCGSDNGSFGFGFVRNATEPPYWLCPDCWRLTPAGQAQLLEVGKRLLGELDGDDDDADLCPDETVA